MPDGTVTITLPASTTLIVQSFVNAAWQQRITITPEQGEPIIFSGSGYYDTPIGHAVMTTQPGTASKVIVTVDHSSDGGKSWQPSRVDSVFCKVMYYAMIVVVSEDAGDKTWDDATTYFSWTRLPPEPSQPSRSTEEIQAADTLYGGRA
jgi:hypothetical protein